MKHIKIILSVFFAILLSLRFITFFTSNPHSNISSTINISSPSHFTAYLSENDTTTTHKTINASDFIPYIDHYVSHWESGNLSSSAAITHLENFLTIDNTEVIDYANKKINYILLETNSNSLLFEAESLFSSKKYIPAIRIANKINPEYSNYLSVMEVISFSQQEVLNEVSSPETVEEYEQYISLLTECISLVDNHKISIKKHQLENELIILKDILSIIDNSSSLYDNGEYSESFMTLALGLDKYPKNELLSTSLVDFHDHYIIHITKQVNLLCEEKEYSVALNIIDEAINEYNCNEFIILKESVKEQKNFFYRLKNNIVDKFNAYSPGWTSEELDVKQMANTAGSYAVKSGKNLILGDYSGEDITVLSFTGNMVAALAGVDWIFDLRDISYDLAHWGEDEYFAVYLAADVVALLPVVGAIKYFNHFKTATDGLKTASDLADSVSDMSKNVEKAADIVDTLSPTLKNSDELIDAINNAKAISKLDKVDDICLNIKKGYEYQDTINSRYAGKFHPETGIKYNLEKVEYSDGRKIQAVFPDFDSYADIELPADLYKSSSKQQEKYCLEELNKKNKSLFNSTKKQFTEQQLDDISNGITPTGFTWHHSEEEGLMQLVDSAIHQDTRHTGGMSLWGIGY